MTNLSRRTFLQQAGYGVAGIGLAPLLTQCRTAYPSTRSFAFSRVSPESQGIASSGILDFVRAANESGLEWHSFMLLRHGKAVAEGWWAPFARDYKHTLYSLSKSFTSTAVGLAVHEGKLRLDDQVISFFPDQAPENTSPHLRAMTIRHLLTMNTGHETDSFGAILQKIQEPWIPAFLAHPVEREPGTHFVYDTGATFMLSAIVQKVTGEPLEVYLRSRLFEPLGVRDYDWEKSPEGINTGGFGLRITTETIARFGQLYLQNGRWEDRQILPEAWVREATSKHTDSHPGDGQWSQGYGYQFWRCKPETVYRGDGAYGQYCIVMPKYDAVLAVTSESWDMGKSMDIMFDNLLPAFSDRPLAENAADWARVKTSSAALRIPVPKGAKASATTERINGRTFRLEENEFGVREIRFDFADGGCTLQCSGDKGNTTLKSGLEEWRVGDERPVNPFPVFFRTSVPSKIAATATWTAPDTLQVNLKFVEAIHGDQYTCRFAGDSLEMTLLNSVASQDNGERNRERRPVLKGVLV